MSTHVLLPILSATRWNRRCLKCQQPITLARRADTKTLCAFEPDPRAFSYQQTPEGVVAMWSSEERHRCRLAVTLEGATHGA